LLKDKNGLTEEEFLAGYSSDKYPKPSLTADVIVFSEDGRVLMIKRGGHPFLDSWAFPGGFSEPGESLYETAKRELREETGMTAPLLTEIGFFSDPGRDPRGWVVTEAYACTVPDGTAAIADDDASDAAWFTVKLELCGGIATLELLSGETRLTAKLSFTESETEFGKTVVSDIISCNGIAFDHAKMLLCALLKRK